MHAGAFGKFLVLLPVEGGYEGGEVKVEELNKFHDFTHECHRYFYCCAFFAGCKYEWEPIKRGCMVVLDFDIVWRPSPMSVTSSISLPSFLAATKEIKEILSPWNYQPLKQTVDGEMFLENVVNLLSYFFRRVHLQKQSKRFSTSTVKILTVTLKWANNLVLFNI